MPLLRPKKLEDFYAAVARNRKLGALVVRMNDAKSNGEKHVVAIIGLIVWRWGSIIALGFVAYGSMWIKQNAPSRAQFDTLTGQVQGLREDVIRMGGQKERTEKLETRIERYEDRILELERRSTPRRPLP